ncbi:MAG TPA: hypothetical protein H9830_09180, partial [Candidatus Agrococcus pullicola]|nr:hypothetical protein [Candidatus Agrococcus pullicola]
IPLVPFEQPLGGLVDVFLNYWLLFLPLLLPFTASILHLAVTAGIFFARTYPLITARSSTRWPDRDTLPGVLARRSIALILALTVVQAVFEPDYGSSLRHLTPLMPLAIVLLQAMRSGSMRRGQAVPWSWTGAPRPSIAPKFRMRGG